MASYRFLTAWLIEAPRQECWDVLADVLSWPEWWPGVASAREITHGDSDRVGSVHRVRWRSFAAYSIELDFTVEQVSEPNWMSGHARGDLEGSGTWRLMEQEDVTAVLYEWDVCTTRPWMDRLHPVASPLFVQAHDRAMRRGGEGLARRLGVRLVAQG